MSTANTGQSTSRRSGSRAASRQGASHQRQVTGPDHEDAEDELLPRRLVEEMLATAARTQHQVVEDMLADAARTQSQNNNHFTMIGVISKAFRDEDRLRPDGSNYRVWGDFLGERTRELFNDHLFFASQAPAQYENLGRSLLLRSVDPSFHRILTRQANCHDMFRTLAGRFSTVSRASQLSLWRRLINFKAAEYKDIPSLGTAISECIDDLKSSQIHLNSDDILGLVVQNSLEPGSQLQQEVDRRLEFNMTVARRNHATPTSEAILAVIQSVQRQFEHETSNLSEQPTTLMTETVHPTPPVDTSSVSQTSNLESSGDAAAFVANPRQCWHCRSVYHFADQCPHKSQAQLPPRGPNTTYNSRPTVQPRLSNGFQAFYPIVAPPGLGAVYPTFNSRQYSVNRPTSGPATQQRPAQYYRPRYPVNDNRFPLGGQAKSTSSNSSYRGSSREDQPSSVSTRMVELGGFDPSLDELNFDHVNVHEPSEQAIVDSGVGTLTFQGEGGEPIDLNGVLY